MNYAVIGYPLKHTLSPVIHNANFNALDIDADYSALEIKPEALNEIKTYVEEKNLSGFNVTVPHKENIMQYLDEIAPAAEKIGAVNTVHVKNGRYYGYNTDITGYMKAFNEAFGSGKRSILILGAGGAAKAVHRAHADNGDDVTILARRAESFESFKTDDFKHVLNTEFEGGTYDAVINATPLGLNGEDVFKMMNLDPSFITEDTAGMDLIYNPAHTPFMSYFKKNANGLSMLVNQALDAFEIWTAKTGRNDAVQHALEGLMEEK
ncbi:Shikimate dehydrogenase [Jeotgalicoccus saudimassiliensis]|uniref:Shikimate dehydrogenase (NADP(+)) n=1 Tax=Jeotgalicoccus saudimassiliensis TaxID=1461582 RepID=A0A078M5E3_9STAP|nr:shikimate dehydrogenase [Jeotgalicoccus saudimassiliensis]CDZ99921.1 Shikimate dehydrogenase [Jeotgalicoccus saudimassiliensis]